MSGTVVVIEDDPEVADLVTLVLESRGLHVVREPDGESGLATVRRLRPTAVVSDALLPGRTGFEVCRAIKDDPGLCAIRVVLLSGVYRQSRYGREAADAGADLFLAKPVQPAELVKALTPVIGADPPSESRDEFDEALAAARDRYRLKVPGRLDEAEVLLARLSTAWDPQVASDLRLVLHGLAGGGATMGLARLGELARELELLTDRLIGQGRAPDAAERRRLRRSLTVMRRAFG